MPKFKCYINGIKSVIRRDRSPRGLQTTNPLSMSCAERRSYNYFCCLSMKTKKEKTLAHFIFKNLVVGTLGKRPLGAKRKEMKSSSKCTMMPCRNNVANWESRTFQQRVDNKSLLLFSGQ